MVYKISMRSRKHQRIQNIVDKIGKLAYEASSLQPNDIFYFSLNESIEASGISLSIGDGSIRKTTSNTGTLATKLVGIMGADQLYIFIHNYIEKSHGSGSESNISDMLNSFGWRGTYEGHRYWHDIYKKLIIEGL